MRPGTTIELSGESWRVESHLGAGGEGDVFEIANRDGSGRLALKWYHEARATPERRAAIAALVNRGAPSDRFLWPLGMIEDTVSGRFGYVMDVRPDGFVGLADLLRGIVKRDDSSVVRFAFELALAFRELHLLGLCYRDINFGNAFMHAETGAALVCDNDNVSIEGVGKAQVLGSKKFMAPEIVRGEALPSKYTDRYSLAVMLFYLLVVHHPLEGARTEVGLADNQADLRHYGYDPVFCFDPADDSNRPVPDLHRHVGRMWRALPTRVRRLFERSFTDGLAHPRRRVVDSEWCAALAEMRSGLFDCDQCGGTCFLDDGNLPVACAHCTAPPQPILALHVNGHVIAAREGATVTAHHVHGDYDFDTVLGTVERHPTDPFLFGLRNDTAGPMIYMSEDGQRHTVPATRRAKLAESATITVGGAMATVMLT